MMKRLAQLALAKKAWEWWRGPRARASPAPCTGEEHVDGMTDRDDFLAWVETTLYEAELALHNGDAAPRRALWSPNEPVSVLGAFRDAHGQQELNQLFTALGD